MSPVKLEVLKALSSKNETYEIILIALGVKGRSREQIDIPRFHKNLKAAATFDEKQFWAFWPELAATGVGIVKYSTRNNPRKFKFNYALKTVGEIALGGPEQLRLKEYKVRKNLIKLHAPATEIVKTPEPVFEERRRTEPNDYVIRLSNGHVLHLTRTELDEIAEIARDMHVGIFDRRRGQIRSEMPRVSAQGAAPTERRALKEQRK